MTIHQWIALAGVIVMGAVLAYRLNRKKKPLDKREWLILGSVSLTLGGNAAMGIQAGRWVELAIAVVMFGGAALMFYAVFLYFRAPSESP